MLASIAGLSPLQPAAGSRCQLIGWLAKRGVGQESSSSAHAPEELSSFLASDGIGSSARSRKEASLRMRREWQDMRFQALSVPSTPCTGLGSPMSGEQETAAQWSLSECRALSRAPSVRGAAAACGADPSPQPPIALAGG